MKSQAPRRMASTARSTLPHAVITITGDGVALRLQAGQQVHALLPGGGVAGVVQVRQDQVEGRPPRTVSQQRCGRIGRHGLPALALQQQPQGLQHVGLIVADQHTVRFRFRFHRSSTSGPLPGCRRG